MRIYFSCEQDCAVKVNGVFMGRIAKLNLKLVDLNLSDIPFVELGFDSGNVNLFIGSEFLTSPPDNVCVVNLDGGYLVKILYVNTVSTLKVIAQQKSNDGVYTVFRENGNKLSIEYEGGFYTENLQFDFNDVAFKNLYMGSHKYDVVIFKGEEYFINVYERNDKVRKIMSFTATDYSFDGEFIITEKLKDIAKHQIVWRIKFDDGTLKKERVSITHSPNFIKENVCDEVIPYAFLEELMIGGDTDSYLSEGILDRKDDLKAYLGDFIGIYPPPDFREEDEVGLIYKKSENLYYVRYCTFSVENKKITNLTLKK